MAFRQSGLTLFILQILKPESSIKLNVANQRVVVLNWTEQTFQTLYQLLATAGLQEVRCCEPGIAGYWK